MLHEIWTICSIGNTIYTDRNRIGKLLLKNKIGRIILAVVMLPFFVYLLYGVHKMYKDPQFIKIIAKINAQKKISDFC